MERLGSVAGTQNIDRILRLPGTTNLPNNKEAQGGPRRVPDQTDCSSTTRRAALDDFPAAVEAEADIDTKSHSRTPSNR